MPQPLPTLNVLQLLLLLILHGGAAAADLARAPLQLPFLHATVRATAVPASCSSCNCRSCKLLLVLT
jgi:hypothetical protein